MYTMKELLNMGQIEQQARARIRGAYSTVAQIANGEPIDPTKPRAPLGEFARAFGGYTL